MRHAVVEVAGWHRGKWVGVFSVAAWLAAAIPAAAQMSVALSPSVQSPAPLGTVVTWTATVSGAKPGTLWYRFRARFSGTDYRTVVDYGPNSTLDWSSIDREGSYQIEVLVKNQNTGDTAATSSKFALTSLVSGNGPTITATANPLVFIYSAPACAVGRMRVQFQSAAGLTQTTSWKACSPRFSTNFYLAGLLANTQYTVQHTVDIGDGFLSGPAVVLSTTGASAPGSSPGSAVPLVSQIPSTQPILLQSLIGGTVATDLNGNLVWYYPGNITNLTRPVSGGTFLGIGENAAEDPSQQFFREFDLAGITLAETNAARVNEQLAAIGVHSINAFHHEARKLPDGKYLVLAASERILTDVQGPGPVDILGDTILVLDTDLQVVWAWDAFNNMDPHRMAVLGETCTYPSDSGCPPFYLATTANDWLHGNSLQLTPDGNILYSSRHQDWILKINYANGYGDGTILWTLGYQGDFYMTSQVPNPWFSHQHDPNFEADGSTLLVYDDGNTRAATDNTAHSRGQVLKIDDRGRTATLLLNADLGNYSEALGSAQLLTDGNYHFDSGYIVEPSASPFAQSLEVNPAGAIVYGIQFGSIEYRSFRMQDLYTAP
jgi:arylsulfate sulfotransferase